MQQRAIHYAWNTQRNVLPDPKVEIVASLDTLVGSQRRYVGHV